MKFIISFCLIAALATVAWTRSESWGRRLPHDYLMYRENVLRRPQNGHYWNVNLAYPSNSQVNRRNITAIYVYDRFTNNSGAQATLRSGGPGYKFANINLLGQYSKGIHSEVQYYGR